jgi:hypothetical protein
MRRALAVVALVGVWASLADADPQNLASGALITHCTGWYRYHQPQCYNYFQYDPISSCDEQNASMQGWGSNAWFVIAAFAEDKEWCGVEFGFSNYDPAPIAIYGYEACAPGSFLEIPTPGWPGPNEGTAFVTTDIPWAGNFLPVYWFYGYVYDYTYGCTIMQLVPDPATGLGGFTNCASPPQTYAAALGGLGVNRPGVEVCWGWQEFVCCVGTDCVLVQGEDECTALGGVFHSEWDNCGPPNPCGVTPVSQMTWGHIKAMYR